MPRPLVRTSLAVRLIALFLTLAAGLWLAAAVRGSPAKPRALVLLVSPGDAQSSWLTAAQAFASDVASRSRGRLQVTVQPADSAANALVAVRAGKAQLAVLPTTALEAVAPAMAVFDLPYLMPTYAEAHRLLDGETGRRVADTLPDAGLRGLVYWEEDYRQLGNVVRPVTNLAEMQDLRIHVPPLQGLAQWPAELGAVPVPQPVDDLRAALAEGQVQAVDDGILAAYAKRSFEFLPYFTLTQHVYMPAMLVANEGFFADLAEAERVVLQGAAARARDLQRRVIADERAEKLAFMRERGLRVSTLSPQMREVFREASRPVHRRASDVVDAILSEYATPRLR